MRAPSFRRLFASLVLLALSGCPRGDPKTVRYWAERIGNDHSERERRQDFEHLAQVAKDSAEPDKTAQIAALLKQPTGDTAAEAAKLLGELGDKSAVPALVEAIDPAAPTPSALHANKAIAEALGKLGDKAAVPGLLKLLDSKDTYTLVATIDALAALRDASAVAPLSHVATATGLEVWVNRHAILALGQIGDPSALPALHQMLYQGSNNVTFFPESSFAMYEIGKPATELLLSDLKNGDAKFSRWAQSHGILRGAILAKTAQLLGDLNDPRAEPELISLLGYKDSNADLQRLTHVQAADALGRMRSKGAVKPLLDQLADPDGATRTVIYRALDFIGDRSAVPAIMKKAESNELSGYRIMAYHAAALLADDPKAYDAALAGESKRLQAECAQNQGEPAECQKQEQGFTAQLKEFRAALATQCAPANVGCWKAKLADTNVTVRQRAALELGRSGKPEALAALLDAVHRPIEGMNDDDILNQVEARFAAIQGAVWLLDDGAKPADAAALSAKLEQQAEEEKKHTATMRSAEDVKRLAVRLRRG